MDNENQLINVDQSNDLSNDKVKKLYKEYVNPGLERVFDSFDLGNEIVDHAEGVWITTKNNEKILDITGGFGVLSHGHNHPRILKIRTEFQKQKRMEVHKTIFSPYLAALSHNIAHLLPGDLNYSFFCNSGAEAVEGALKLAYKFHEGERKVVLHSDISFHGKLLGSASVTATKEVHFTYPRIPNTDSFEFNNIDSVKEKINSNFKESGESNIYAIIIEPFSAGSVRQCSTEFLQELQRLCNDNKIILIFDEIYTGWYKTGKMFYFQNHDVLPDILTTSKSLGGGKASISAYISRKPILEKAYGNTRDAFLHTTTYNGFGEECATAIEALNIMQEENYEEKSYNIEKIAKIRCRKLLETFNEEIKYCRGSGAYHGIFFNFDQITLGKILKLLPLSITQDDQFIPKLVAASFSNWLYRHHKMLVLFTKTEETALLFQPSLVINENEINSFFDALEDALNTGINKILIEFIKKQFTKIDF